MHATCVVQLDYRYYNRVFGWRAERAGSERTRPRGCLDGRWEGWVGSRREYSAQMWVGSVLRKVADGANPAGFRPSRTPPFVVSISLPFSPCVRELARCRDGCHGRDGRSLRRDGRSRQGGARPQALPRAAPAAAGGPARPRAGPATRARDLRQRRQGPRSPARCASGGRALRPLRPGACSPAPGATREAAGQVPAARRPGCADRGRAVAGLEPLRLDRESSGSRVRPPPARRPAARGWPVAGGRARLAAGVRRGELRGRR